MSNGKAATGGAGERRVFFILLAVIMAVTLGFALYTFSRVAELEAIDREALIETRDIRLNSPEVAQLARSGTRGDFESFAALRRIAEQIDAAVGTLGGRTGRVISEQEIVQAQERLEAGEGATEASERTLTQGAAVYSEAAVVQAIEGVDQAWGQVADQVNTILQAQTPLGNVYRLADEIQDEYIGQLREALQALVDDLVARNARPAQVARVGELILYNAQLSRDLQRLLRDPTLPDDEQEDAAAQLIINVANIGEILDGLDAGSEDLNIAPLAEDSSSRELLGAATEIFFAMGDLMFELEERLPDLYDARESAAQAEQQVRSLATAGENLEAQIQTLEGDRFLSAEIGYYAGAAGLIAMILLGGISFSDTRRRHADTVRQKQVADQLNQRNQEAILQLLDEMSYLADGDLSKHATVTEEITGAIADSVNYAIDALRNLVTSINQTSQEVTGAAQKSRATTLQLALSSQKQAGQIAEASTRIGAMAQSMEKVSSEAGNSADVAKRSVEIAHQGGEVVRSSISGMDTLREQIQETSKRIKRLGESSQEIGAIVELINDIADQTNILALNAAIQAAMAGEAGRGFAVVADEVQRLAERSTDATKQIAALINTIQADTNEAVTSMERSTANVVSGAQLASDAGSALEEIENVSNQLYELIQEIADTAQNEAGTAAQVAETMNGIREVTTQTTAGTNETANAIGRLAELAEQLRDSVAGFKLPEEPAA
jgi:twitching motility protein PilJ